MRATNLMADKENALLVGYGQNIDFADAICTMIDNDELRKKIISNGLRTINSVFSRVDFRQISKLVSNHLNLS